MRTSRHVLLAAAVALAAPACAPKTLYHWNGYDDALYRHYKSPQERDQWVEALKTVILSAEEHGTRVPPGVCAEYGYALFEEKAHTEAISYFEREKREWPESQLLMDKMIRNAQVASGQAVPAAKAPAPAAKGASKGAASTLESKR